MSHVQAQNELPPAGADVSGVQARDGPQGGQAVKPSRCKACRFADAQCVECAAVDKRRRELEECTESDVTANLKRYIDALEGPEPN